MPEPTAGLITTKDIANCPRCDSPAVRTGRNDRICNGCGLAWTVHSEADELDAKADREVRSREFSEDRGWARAIPKGANRW